MTNIKMPNRTVPMASGVHCEEPMEVGEIRVDAMVRGGCSEDVCLEGKLET